MEYRFTDTNSMKVSLELTLCDIDDLRNILSKAMDAKLEDVSRWRMRNFIRALADAQAKAADIMALDAKGLADKAKLPEGF